MSSKGRYVYDYPRPAVTTDAVVFGLEDDTLKVLLIERGQPPFEGAWALPGGFVHEDETLDDGVRRELQEETGLEGFYLEQLYTFGDPGRDPRGRTVTVAYYALVNMKDHVARAATDAADAAWHAVSSLPALAFDHDRIIATALERLRGKVRYRPIGFELLPPSFSLSQLQQLYETVTEHALDKRNFRKKVLSLDLLVETGELTTGPGRPAQLYRFDRERYLDLEREGFEFSL